MPSVMPSQLYALLALCLAGVMPFCARKIYLNTLYLARFCMKYALFRSFLHEKRRFYLNMMFLRKKNRRRPFPGTRARVICTRNATFDTRLVKKRSKSKKLTKSTFNKCVLLRISVRIQCPIPNCPKSHIRHNKKIKNLKFCLLPIA